MQGSACFGRLNSTLRKRLLQDSLTFETASPFETIEFDSRILDRALRNASMCTADIHATESERQTRQYFEPQKKEHQQKINSKACHYVHIKAVVQYLVKPAHFVRRQIALKHSAFRYKRQSKNATVHNMYSEHQSHELLNEQEQEETPNLNNDLLVINLKVNHLTLNVLADPGAGYNLIDIQTVNYLQQRNEKLTNVMF